MNNQTTKTEHTPTQNRVHHHCIALENIARIMQDDSRAGHIVGVRANIILGKAQEIRAEHARLTARVAELERALTEISESNNPVYIHNIIRAALAGTEGGL